MRIVQSDYDKHLRCPGWSGSGWTNNKTNWCDDPHTVPRWSERARNFDSVWWSWKIRKTQCCNTIVLPPVLVWINWRTWIPRKYGKGLWYWYPGMKLEQTRLWGVLERGWEKINELLR